jgi:tetratricopeptide (TPR) repeat protein
VVPPASFARARELHAAAVALQNQGQPVRAMAKLARALALLERDSAENDRERARLAARIWISTARSEAEVRSSEAGFAALDTAQGFVDRLDDPGLRVLLFCQRGLIELRGGSLARSRTSLDAAAELLEHAAPRDQASVLINRGNVAIAEGRLAEARADFERSAEISAQTGLAIERLHSQHNLAYVEFLLGELARALRLMDEARHSGMGEDGIVLLDRARVLIEAGLATDADDSLARAATLFRRHRVAQDLGETELERARCALARGEMRLARRFAGSARRRFLRRGSDRWRRSAELVLLQADLVDGRPPGRVVPPAQRLAAEFESEGLRLHARAAHLIAIEAGLAGGAAEAAASGLAELGPPRADDPVTGRMHDHYVRAKVSIACGRSSEAAARIRRALDELARYQASFGSIDLRTASAVHGRRLAELDVSLALRGGRATSIFAAAERARAVSSRMPPVRPPDDPVAAELLADLRRTIESLHAVEQDSAASEPLLRKRRELERQIVARSWTVSGSGAVGKPASFEGVRQALRGRDRTMVTYVQASGALCAIVIGERANVHDLGPAAPVLEHVQRVRADLDVLAHPTLPPGIRTAVRASLDRSLAALERTLLAPLRVDGALVLVSTGVLSRLPWASLPSLRGRSLVVAPSATKWLASTEAPGARRPSVIALSGPGLGRGEAEVDMVGAVWPAARVARNATAGALLDAAASATVLHVAAHGLHQPENPLFSSVRMSDGPVFAHEIDQGGHAPEHVVLSACEVGLATIRPGDEALGLASALLNLGTRSVIASVARVGDEVAERTMAAYHASLAGGLDSAASLAAALDQVDADVVPPFVTFGAAWFSECGVPEFGAGASPHVT